MIRNEFPVCDGLAWTDVLYPSEEDMDKLSQEFHLDEHIVRDCLQPEHLPW